MILNRKGFTLIEIIAVLVLMGIVFALAGGGIVAGVKGYLLARENAVITQKAQLALSRLSREIQECFNCTGTPGTSISLPFHYRNTRSPQIPVEIDYVAGAITIDGNTLVDQVAGDPGSIFSHDNEGRVVIVLTLTHQSEDTPVTFRTSVRSRNTYF